MKIHKMPRYYTTRMLRVYILLSARQLNYRLKRVNNFSYVLERYTEKNGKEVINIYWNKKNTLFTVLTALDHPRKGKTQMTRKFLSKDSVINILNNPRLHTDRGYQRKK